MVCAATGLKATQPLKHRLNLMANKLLFLISCSPEVFCHSNRKQNDTDRLDELSGGRKVRVTLQRGKT